MIRMKATNPTVLVLEDLVKSVKDGAMLRKTALSIARIAFPGLAGLEDLFPLTLMTPAEAAQSQGFPLVVPAVRGARATVVDPPYSDAVGPGGIDRMIVDKLTQKAALAREFDEVKVVNRRAEATLIDWSVTEAALADFKSTEKLRAEKRAKEVAINARLVVLQGKDAIGKVGHASLEKQRAEGALEGCRLDLRDGRPLATYWPWVPITEANQDLWFVVDLESTPPTDAALIAAYQEAQRDDAKGLVRIGRGTDWIHALIVGDHAIDIDLVRAAWSRGLAERTTASDRARKYRITCQGDHPLDYD
jgi:hypothetical protein